MTSSQMIVGITGTSGSGKGTVVNYLVDKKGFKHFPVSEYLSEEVKTRGLIITRDSMIEVANNLRKNNSPSYIVEQLLARAIKSGSKSIIESLRNPDEVRFLQNQPGFRLIAVDADPKVRYERIRKRKSLKDDVSFEEFLEQEQHEMQSVDPNSQNLSQCMRMADFKMLNDGTIEELYQKVEEVLIKIENADAKK